MAWIAKKNASLAFLAKSALTIKLPSSHQKVKKGYNEYINKINS